jgi:hypothetical protein
LFVFKGGLFLEGVVASCAGLARLPFSSPQPALRFELDRRCCKDSLRGFVFAGMLEIRRGMDGGPAFWLFAAKYVWICERLGERR